MLRIPRVIRRLALPAALFSLTLTLMASVVPGQGQNVRAQQSTLDNLPVFFVAFEDTDIVRSFDAEGNFLDDDDGYDDNFGVAGSDIEGLAIDYVTLDGQFNPFGNVITADAETGNLFAGIGLVDSSGIGFGIFAGFDANDTLMTGNVARTNDSQPSGLSLGATREEIAVADPDTGIIEFFSFEASSDGNPFSKVGTLTLDYSAGDAIAMAKTDQRSLGADKVDEILIADADSGTVRRFDASGLASGQFPEANYQAGDGFATGNVDGFGREEFLIGRAATGEIAVFEPEYWIIRCRVRRIRCRLRIRRPDRAGGRHRQRSGRHHPRRRLNRRSANLHLQHLRRSRCRWRRVQPPSHDKHRHLAGRQLCSPSSALPGPRQRRHPRRMGDRRT